jgi:transposase
MVNKFVCMGNARGVKRDFDALEARRWRAVRLFQRGERQAEVARLLGVHRQTVYRWAKCWESEGRTALKKAGRAGRKPRLSVVQLRGLERGLKRGPEVLGYETSLWTTPRVADLIERECGIRFHPGHVWKLLRQLGWSCQRPVGRALERDEAAIRGWKKRRWPELKKKPKKKGEPSSSSMKAD